MVPVPFSKEWRQMLIRQHSKARVVAIGFRRTHFSRNHVTGVPGFNPLERQVRRLTK